MTDLRTAAQQAIGLICSARLCEINSMSSRQEMLRLMIEATDTLRAALAEPVQEPDVPETNFGNMEPVGWLENPFGSFRRNWLWKLDPPPQTLAWSIPLYTAPPQRKPLSEDEALDIARTFGAQPWPPGSCVAFARAIERAHGIT